MMYGMKFSVYGDIFGLMKSNCFVTGNKEWKRRVTLVIRKAKWIRKMVLNCQVTVACYSVDEAVWRDWQEY